MKRSVIIIGAGPAGLMLAASLDNSKYDVTIVERNSTPGRKFLVAGDGGLNITHSEERGLFIRRYSPSGFLENAFFSFDNRMFTEWLLAIGVPTFAGTSGRVFPLKTLKPIDVLNAIVETVRSNGVHFLYRHTWKGFAGNGDLLFGYEGGDTELRADIRVFALGGASWPVTGSAGDWLSFFSGRGITTKPFTASNCTMLVQWPDEFIKSSEGSPLKNISVTCGEVCVKGEIVITGKGMEGSGVYPLSPVIREALRLNGKATVMIDLKPSFSHQQILERLHKNAGKAVTDLLRRSLNLSVVQVKLLKVYTTREQFSDPVALSALIKSLPLTITGLGPFEDAISTVGGISLDEIGEDFMLRKMQGHFAIGEMLDYDAPTGGYLLQSCFSMGYYLAKRLNEAAIP